MNNNNKAPNSVNRHQVTCTRTDRDMYRICPAKLTRRELENLYFTLVENNVDLKKNLNLQQDKIKTLSAKVQRMSYPRNTNGAGKDSPVTTAIVNEQKDSIIKLKKANECMMERIRVLNMKLNSLKQFAGKPKPSNLNNVTLSSSNTRSNCSATCSYLLTAGTSQVKTNTVGTQTDFFAEKCSNSSCDIKCKPNMDGLNVKINNLQKELQTSQQRIEKLEALVMRLQGENQTVRAERAASEHLLQQLDANLDEQKEKLRCAEAKVNDLNMELTIEKKKLAELETELKLGGNIMSSSAAKTIEELEQKKRDQFKIQEPVSNNEVKAMSRDTEQKPINYRNIPKDEFDSSHPQSIEKLSTVSAIAQELKSNIIPKSSRSDGDQIPGPISVDFNDQNREVSGEPYFRKSIDSTPEKNTDLYRSNKMSYVEINKQIGSISESPLKNIIDGKSAKSKDSYGKSLRKRSLEEKSENIRKTFSEHPNRISLEQSSDDIIIRKPFRDVTDRQSFDEKVMQIRDTDNGERPVRKSKDPLSTRPSISLSDRTARVSLDNSSKDIFDVQPRLSLSPKATLIIKDYARDIEAKSRKVRQRFSTPCATVIQLDPSRSWQSTESIRKSQEAATSSPHISAPGVNDSPSTSFQLNMDVDGNAAPTVGGQDNAGTEPATTADHSIRDVNEPFEICGASVKVCECPPSELRRVSTFRTCTDNICFRTTQPKDNIRHCACATALEHNYSGMDAGPSSRRESSTSMENKAPRTYSVADKHSRASSPDNTDHEISCMTDLASEKYGLPERSPQITLGARSRICSLSEERGTTTSTDVPSDHYTTASEGEVLGVLSSLGERDPGLGPYQGPRESIKPDTMEATLQTISDELERCRKLLLSQRDQEVILWPSLTS